MIILDIDNCIADDKWRIPLINHEAANDFVKFHAYHMASAGDPHENRHVIEPASSIAIITSRPVNYRWLTVDWLERHKIAYDFLFMREKVDGAFSSPEVKRKAVRTLITAFGHQAITMAYDDRPDVIAMYREEGIPATHLFIHPYDWKEWYGERSGHSGPDGFHL